MWKYLVGPVLVAQAGYLGSPAIGAFAVLLALAMIFKGGYDQAKGLKRAGQLTLALAVLTVLAGYGLTLGATATVALLAALGLFASWEPTDVPVLTELA